MKQVTKGQIWIRDLDSPIVRGLPSTAGTPAAPFQEGTTLNLSRADLATGKREFLRTLKAGSATGTTRVRSLVVADDADVYAYEVARQLSRMFLVRGVQSK